MIEDDYMKSAVPNLVPVIDRMYALLYYGQFDLRDPYGPSWDFIQVNITFLNRFR